MSEREPMTQVMNATQLRKDFSQVLNQVHRQGTRIVVEKSGIPVAAVISAKDLERLRQFEQERSEDFAALHEIGRAFQDVPPEEIEQEVTRALGQARQQQRTTPLPDAQGA